jgi:hypothetical protein
LPAVSTAVHCVAVGHASASNAEPLMVDEAAASGAWGSKVTSFP